MSGIDTPSPATLPATPARLLLGFTMLSASGWFVWESVLLQAIPATDRVGPGAFPGLIALTMAGASAAALFGFGEQKAALFVVERPRRVLAALVALVLFVAALGQAPMLAVLLVFAATLQFIVGERRPVVLAAGAGLLTLAVWLLFGLLLRVPL